MHYSDARTKTTEYHEWASNIMHQLSYKANKLALAELREKFDPKKHDFVVHMSAIYPPNIFTTKEGILSSRTIDCSNWEKPLIDLFFDKQYFDRPSPYGCENLNINDKHIIRLMSLKKPGTANQLVVSIKIVPRIYGLTS
jgi:hypothetical protein